MLYNNGDDHLDIQFDKQYPVYALDTACFYTDEEAEIEEKMNALRIRLSEDRPKKDPKAKRRRRVEQIGRAHV